MKRRCLPPKFQVVQEPPNDGELAPRTTGPAKSAATTIEVAKPAIIKPLPDSNYKRLQPRIVLKNIEVPDEIMQRAMLKYGGRHSKRSPREPVIKEGVVTRSRRSNSSRDHHVCLV